MKSTHLSAAPNSRFSTFILENPEETTELTVRELATRTFSSPSSVLRVCRAIGFQGYKDLRHALILELATLGERGSHPEQEVAPEDGIQEMIDKVTHKNVQSLLDTQRLLTPEVVEACVNLLSGARMIMLFGIGASLLAAKDAYLKFLRLNKPCVVNEDWHSQLLQAVNSSPQDVGIVFSYSGQTVEIDRMYESHEGEWHPGDRRYPVLSFGGGPNGRPCAVHCCQRIPVPQRSHELPPIPDECNGYPVYRVCR